jgi:hypothetical protein
MFLIVNFFFVQSTNQMELLWASLQQTPNPAPVQQIPTVFLIIEAVFSYINFGCKSILQRQQLDKNE